jgi:hypothetical protein
MTADVQEVGARNSGTTVAVTGLTVTAGHAFTVSCRGYIASNTTIHLASVADNASGGSNTWTYSTSASSQNPAAAGSYDTTETQYAFAATAVCLPSANGGTTKAFTSVTVTFNVATSFNSMLFSEFSGLPAGSVITRAASTSTAQNGVTSYTTPVLTTPSTSLVLAATAAFSDFTGVTAGYTMQTTDGNHDAAYNPSAAAGSVSATFTGSSNRVPCAVITAVGQPTEFGAAALSGSGAMGAAWELEAAAGLSGSGALGAAGTGGLLATAGLSGSGALGGTGTGGNVAAAAGLSGSGALGGTAQIWVFQAALSGSGAMGALGGATYLYATALSGSGLLSAGVPAAWMDGEGSLGISGEALGYVIGLSGSGTLSIPQVIGALTAGAGGASIPYALPGSSQVAVAPPGSGNWQWLGTLGQVTALAYGYVCPGGCDQMSLTLMVPAAYRTQLLSPGWQVRITRGGHQVWDGKLDEPAPSASGWTITAVGTGNRGADFTAIYSDTWPAGQPDESVNQAISRGLPWVNPGIGTPAGMWLGQEIDPGAQTITALLNLVCTRGGLTWYVNSQPGGLYSGDDLTVFPLPTVPNRLLVCTTPVARTLGGDVNTIVIRYQNAADNAATGAAATFAVTTVQNAQDVAAHQVTETYIDLSAAGTMTQAAAQAVGSAVLQVYQRASFAGPFTASYGQLLNLGGTPIDPGTDQAGTMVRLILTDFGYGGEVTPQFPVTFVVGAYVWDDFAQVATITPYQSLDTSLTGMLSMETTVLTPITAGS